MRNSAKFMVAAGVVTAAVWVSAQASAGQQTSLSVSIGAFPGGQFANGQMGTARSSGNVHEAIGCYVRQYVLPTASLDIICSATTATGASLSCSSNDTRLRDAIQTIGPNSRIGFGVNGTGGCLYVLVENSSKFQPLQP